MFQKDIDKLKVNGIVVGKEAMEKIDGEDLEKAKRMNADIYLGYYNLLYYYHGLKIVLN